MLNFCVLSGRLTADPELKTTNSGISVCSFTLAVDRDFKQGDEKVADFIPVTTWRHTAEFVSKYFSKGSMATVQGQLQSRRYEDKEGNKRTAYEVQAQNVYFAGSKRNDQSDTAPTGSVFTEAADQGGELPF